jgi:hypothetical protein
MSNIIILNSNLTNNCCLPVELRKIRYTNETNCRLVSRTKSLKSYELFAIYFP